MNPHFWWYLARASGIVSYLLLAAAVLTGLARSNRLTRRPRPAWVQDLHRYLGSLALVFVGIHMAGLALDTEVHFGPAALLVPMASGWSPGAVAWGVVGFYLLLAVELTSLLMRHLPRPLWRVGHLASFPLFAVSTVHLAVAGTDRSSPALQWAALLLTGAVVGLSALRLLERRGARIPVGAPARRVEAAPDGAQLGGQVRVERLVFAGDGMGEAQAGRVQERTPDRDRRTRAAVGGVTDHRVPDRAQVHPDLVGAARLQLHVEEGDRRVLERADHLVAGAGRPAALADGHAGGA